MAGLRLLLCISVLVAFSYAQAPTKIGFFYDGTLDDGNFLASANEGVTRIKDKYGSLVEVGFNGPTQNMTFLRILTEGSSYPFPPAFTTYNIILCVGFEYNAPVSGWAKQFPSINFILIDDVISPTLQNVQSVIFAENEAGYIAGAAAGLVSKTKTVALLGGIEISPVRKYITGFSFGILRTCPECKVVVKYIRSFADSVTGLQLAEDVVTNYNADIIFPVAGGSGTTVITDLPALYPNIWTIGVDTDAFVTILGGNSSSPGAKGLLLSVGKSLSNAAFQTLDQFVSSKVFSSGTKVLTSASKGIQIFPCHNLCSELDPQTTPTIQSLIDQLTAQEIASGVSNLDGIPSSLRDPTFFNTWQQFKPAYRPLDAIDKLMTTLTVDTFGTQVQLLTAGSSVDTWLFSPTQLVYEQVTDGPLASKAAIASYKELAFVYGGSNANASASSDLWQFNYTTRSWTLLSATITGGPGGRQGHTAAVWNTKLLIFGGTNEQSQLSNELWSYDIVNQVWESLNGRFSDGASAAPRNLHTAVIIGNVMYIYGGQDSRFKVLNDINGYDLVENRWFVPNDTTEALPRLRSHAAVAIGNSMIIVGGTDQGGNKPPYTIRVDLQRFAPKVTVSVNSSLPNVGAAISNCPGQGNSSRGGLSLAAIAVQQTSAETGNIWVFGGSNSQAARQSSMLFNNFNTTLDTLSSSKRKLRFVDWGSGAAISVNVITGLLMVLVLATTVFFLLSIKTPVVSYSNPVALFVQLFALLMLYGAVFTYPGDLTDAQCGIRVWFLGLGVTLLLGPMISKLYRLFRILENTTLLRTAIGTRDVTLISGGVVGVEVLLLVIWTTIDRMKPKIVDAQNNDESVLICSCHHFWIYMGIQLGYIVVLLAVGLFFSIRVRNVSSRVLWGDAVYTSYSVYVIGVAVLILSLVSAFLYKFYLGGYISLMLLYVLALTIVFTLLFSVKLYVIVLNKTQSLSSGTFSSADISTDFKPPDEFNVPL